MNIEEINKLIEEMNKDNIPNNVFTIEDEDEHVLLGKMLLLEKAIGAYGEIVKANIEKTEKATNTSNEAINIANKAYSGIGSNPNLLINGDFSVNQRGIFTNNTISSYMADRWYKRYGEACQIDISSPFAKLTILNTGSGVDGFFRQRIECPTSLIGKYITGSCFIKDYSQDEAIYISISARNNVGTQLTYKNLPLTKNALSSGSLLIPENTAYLDFTIIVNRNIAKVGDYIEIGYCKIEAGSTATAFIPRPYIEELKLCQSYYLEIETNSIFSGRGNSNTTLSFNIPLPTTQRTTGTISINDLVICLPNISYNYTNFTLQSAINTSIGKIITITLNETNPNINYRHILNVYSTSIIKLDAEIY